MANNCIILGLGDHGITVMKDLLRDSSKRGLLRLQYDSIDSSENIEAVRFFHCETVNSPIGLASDEGMFPDLYSAIRTFSARDMRSRHEEIVDLIVNATKALLNAGGQSGATPTLDVFVIARFEQESQMIETDTFLVALFDKLNQLPAFNSPAVTQNLNSVGFYDFLNLTNNDRQGRELRSVLLSSKRAWIRRQKVDKVKAFSRIYVTDEFNDKSHVRNQRARRLQTIAFLQLLVFETLEPPERLALIRSGPGILDQVLASFGIEVVETGVESLCRLAAANYMSKRLNFLTSDSLKIGDHGRSEGDLRISPVIKKYDLENSLGKPGLMANQDNFAGQLKEIESQVTESFLSESSILEIDKYEDRIDAAKLTMVDQAANEVGLLESTLIKPLDEELKDAISDDLKNATPVGFVVRHLAKAQNNLKESDLQLEKEADRLKNLLGDRIREFKQRYERFLKYKELHLNLAKNRWFWFSLSIWLAVLLTPSLSYAVHRLLGIPNPVINDVLLYLQQNPWLIFIICLLALSLPICFLGTRFARAYLDKSLEWFLNNNQGRLIESLRLSATKGPHFDVISINYNRAIIKGLQRSLTTNIDRLQDRVSEAQWLERNLSDYYDDNSRKEKNISDNCVYSIINADSFLESIQDIMPATPVSVTKVAEDEGVPYIFSNWRERFQRDLLSPMAAIDKTSTHYKSRFENENRSVFNQTFKQRTEDFLVKISKKLSANIKASGEIRLFAFMGEGFEAITNPTDQLKLNFKIHEPAKLGSADKLYLVKVITSINLSE